MPQDKHILVVDDKPGIQDFIQRNLELRAFKVSLAITTWKRWPSLTRPTCAWWCWIS